jgi:hypothetical protein
MDTEVTTAQLQPYPRRTGTTSSSFSSGHGLPLFEKSNVLVMYVTNLLSPLAFFFTHSSQEALLAQVS